MDSRVIDYILLIFVIIGAVNWGLIDLFYFNLVYFLFGSGSIIGRIIYGIIGIAGLYAISLIGRVRSLGDSE